MIATTGEALVDLIEQADGRFDAHLGGSVFNISLALARQDMPVAYLNPLSMDKFGERFRSSLTNNGVALPSGPASNSPTSLAVVGLDAEGVPHYMFYRDGVADRDVGAAALVAALPADTELLHTGGLALVDDAGMMFELMQAAQERGAIISVDANLRPIASRDHARYFDDVKRAVSLAHIAKLSDEDLSILGLGELTLQELAEVLFHRSETELIAVTLGARGAALLTRRGLVERAAPRGLEVVDTVGAGDCFHAGLITYLRRAGRLSRNGLRGLDAQVLEPALAHAVACASINITRAGCQPPTWHEARAFARAA